MIAHDPLTAGGGGVPAFDGAWTLVLVAVFAGMSAFFSGAETGILSAGRARLEVLAGRGYADAKRALALVRDRERVLAGTLVGTNLSTVAASSLATAWCVEQWGDHGPAVATALLTPFMLFSAEILPKAFFRTHSVARLRAVASPLRIAVLVLSPLTVIATAGAGLLLTLLRVPASGRTPVFRREDLERVFSGGDAAGASSGGDSENALRMARQALGLSGKRVADAMTPIDLVASVVAESSVADARQVFASGDGRPLAVVDRAGLVIGFLATKAVLGLPGETSLGPLARPARSVEAEEPLDRAWIGFRDNPQPVALVHGAGQEQVGVLTPEDILEVVLGNSGATASESDPR
ncbi:MAG: CNNM domain-containing protein [Gemmatimonadota bacterium]|jgi:CBS domain containing-hemolysin-like protein|nr:hypothetical protein [Gemmatimonadota bacterium]MDP6460329.1 CNNM domain-containing protein [Gemmatimonadota bacterium]MDP6528283.1 CNNM domain-containing protein [Gemmatimonadota bacterium]MDP6803365.1 CNNM domain-containing protein [Gemmatimonadota bacterium]MDP7032622.1 CNNM domain-containing protein [Gemmatimonadota bacterium]